MLKTDIPQAYIEEVEKTKINELREIVIQLENLIEKQDEAIESAKASNDQLVSYIHDTNRILMLFILLIGFLAFAKFL